MSKPSRIRIFGTDLLLPLYLAVLIRQCFWFVDNCPLAWVLTALATLILWGVLLGQKETEYHPPGLFWLVVALPLLLVYACRLAFPDVSFDVLNQRLVQSERALRGFPFISGDFFPTLLPVNPAPDMLGGVFRHILGYRAGTVVSYLAFLWVGLEVEKLLRPYLKQNTLRCLAVLAVLFTEHMLFQINNYVGDLLTLPLLLTATRLALELDQKPSIRPYDPVFIALLLGISLAFKLTNSVIVIPILFLFVQRLVLSSGGMQPTRRITILLTSAAAFIVPLLPYCLYIYQRTSSPVFPLYNKLFASPYWPLINMGDGRWGPQNTYQILVWPLISFFKPERLSELGIYSGRLFLAFFVAITGLLIIKNDERLRWLCFITVLTSILWSATSGYIRYGLYIEALGGVAVIGLAVHLTRRLSKPTWKLLTAALILGVSLAQGVTAAVYVSRYEWSMRPTFIAEPHYYLSELRFLFQDRDLMQFQSPENVALLSAAETWVVSDVKTNGIEIMLKPRNPILALHNEIYFDVPTARKAFTRAIATVASTRMYSLAFTNDLTQALDRIRRRGLGVGTLTSVEIRYFSDYTRQPLTLIEVLPPRRKSVEEQIRELSRNSILADDGYVANLSAAQADLALRPGQSQTINVRIKNVSESIWMAKGDEQGRHRITLRNSWIDAQSRKVINDQDGVSYLPHNLMPGEEIELKFSFKAPLKAGDYILELDMVQEQVAWFHQKGSETLRFSVRVE
jgi:hypothetical protein